MKIDPRIMPVEKLDRTKTVLVDTHSLLVLARVLTDSSVPTFDLSVLTERGGPTLANIMQNIVLYDTIIIALCTLGKLDRRFRRGAFGGRRH